MKVNGKCVMPTCGRFHLQGCGPCRRILFLLRLSRKRESGCCLHLPAATFRPLWIVKSREPDLNWLKQKGTFLAYLIKKAWWSTEAQTMSSRLSASPRGFVCQTLLSGSTWWHSGQQYSPPTPPRCTASAFSSFLEKSWTSCWLTWLRSWTIPEPVPGFRNISSSPRPNLEEWGLTWAWGVGVRKG